MTYKFSGMFVVCKYIAVVWSMVLPSYSSHVGLIQIKYESRQVGNYLITLKNSSQYVEPFDIDRFDACSRTFFSSETTFAKKCLVFLQKSF